MMGDATREVIKDYMDFLNEIENQPEDIKNIAVRVYHTALMAVSGAIIDALEDIKGYSAGILEEHEQ